MSLYPMSDPVYMGPFVDATFSIVGSSDATKTIRFEVDAQTTGDDLTISSGAQTDDRTLSVPVLTANATIAVLSETQTFTGSKTFNAAVTFDSDAIFTSSPGQVRHNTDSSYMKIAGGTDVDPVKGAGMVFFGNTQGSLPGSLFIDCGNASSAAMSFRGYNNNLLMKLTSDGGTSSGDGYAQSYVDFRLATKTPASASATGKSGTIAWDSSYIYICTATDTWKRVAIATW